MSIIAIDYGKSKCGYAIGNVFVSESGTIKTSEIHTKISSFKKIILGIPLSMSGNYSTQTFEVIKFGIKLLKQGKEVLFIDERLTTQMAKTYQKKDDDRFSAEQLLLDYINNPQRVKKLEITKIKQSQEIKAEFAIVIEVPYDDKFNISSGIAFSEDPYTAYTLFSKGFFVYRVFKDFSKSLSEIEKKPECIIINNEIRQILSNLDLELRDTQINQIPVYSFTVTKE
ncbi:Holliday junction resolvase RuvX [Fervidobacterium nodosum]|uniref:Holliday junction resolvase YqgF n=1 Tax=Fervidobacterium nodosum (strain ATCC 35602 / DSM 5306 / Rt17-B1) TaxID=381764 RepID=A7HJW7_FERNB|nr:Holliday junction resolvase RuvX [Fervidobacterium nodosum]ABS60200.1 Holliday junction resolvase YqgF [Fervidobacterium nodosum Rt17-B1]